MGSFTKYKKLHIINKGFRIGKKEVKCSLLRDDHILHVNTPKIPHTKKLHEWINNISKFAG